MTDCLFCRIVAGDIPADIIARSDRAVAFRDIEPKAPVHVLVIPAEHYDDVPSVADADRRWRASSSPWRPRWRDGKASTAPVTAWWPTPVMRGVSRSGMPMSTCWAVEPSAGLRADARMLPT